jgi:hypothetical protein
MPNQNLIRWVGVISDGVRLLEELVCSATFTDARIVSFHSLLVGLTSKADLGTFAKLSGSIMFSAAVNLVRVPKMVSGLIFDRS